MQVQYQPCLSRAARSLCQVTVVLSGGRWCQGVQQPRAVSSLESLLAGSAHLSDFYPLRDLCRVLRDGEVVASGAQKPWKL